jgi:hypothetical protein
MTLWDLIEEDRRSPQGRQGERPRTVRHRPAAEAPALDTMADRYALVTRQMLEHYGVRVRKWRSSMSGIAWQIRYADGKVTKLIEAPRPRGPMSAAVFLHEIGHHAIGFNVYRPRCLEEYHAWVFALDQMQVLGLNITEAVRRRMAESLWYAVSKAQRRGLQTLPPELEPFARRPAPRRRRRS